jgi:serine/threonine protein kinase
MLNRGTFDDFLNLVLSKEYLMRDMGFSQVQAVEHAQFIYGEFNSIVQKDLYIITHVNGKYHMCEENTDLVLVGSGGFATVYKQKSTGYILKKLKEDFLADKGIRSRFKREYNITKSLQDVYGIIEVYWFDEASCSYTMEAAETTLERYIKESVLSDEIRINCIRQILYIITEVHKRDIIHRDLSPNNIFILRGMMKIADFGLGKDLNIFTSHQTVHTNAVGQYYYCAPEQFMLLKEGDKRSDVYSLGRIINFIMSKNPMDSHHMFRSVTEKATNSDAAYRYADAGQLSTYLEKSMVIHQKQERKAMITEKITSGVFDEEIESYIYQLPATDISSSLLKGEPGFSNALLKFMKCTDTHAQYIIQSIDSTFRDVCGRSFDAHDPFATFSYKVLSADFSFIVKEIAANILRYVAKDVNRFSAQRLVEELKKKGLEPLLEDILDS